MRLELLDLIEKCGDIRTTAQRLKLPALLLADMALGCEPITEYVESVIKQAFLYKIGPKSLRNDERENAPGRVALAEYMSWKGVDLQGAADLLGVSAAYLRQQASLRHPTGAVMASLMGELERRTKPDDNPSLAETRQQEARQTRRNVQRKLRKALAEREPRQPKPGSKEWIDAHNARVLAERAAKREPKP